MAGILSREKWNLKNEDGDNERFAEIDKIVICKIDKYT